MGEEKSRRAIILALVVAGLSGCSSLDKTTRDTPSSSAHHSTVNGTNNPPQSETRGDKSGSSPKQSLLTWSLELEETRLSATSDAAVAQSLETGVVACYSESTGEKVFEYGPIPVHAFSTSEQMIYLLDDSADNRDIVSIDSDSWEINWKKQTSDDERIIDSTDRYVTTRSNGVLSIIHNETGDRTTVDDFEFYPFHRIEIFKHFLFAHHKIDEKFRIFDLISGQVITEENALGTK